MTSRWQRAADRDRPRGGENPRRPSAGYGGGITLGTAIGIPLTAAEPRITAAIFGAGFVVGDSHRDVRWFGVDDSFWVRHLGRPGTSPA